MSSYERKTVVTVFEIRRQLQSCSV